MAIQASGEVRSYTTPIMMAEQEAMLTSLTCSVVRERVAFGKPLCEDSVVRHNVANSRMEIEQVSDLRS